MYKKMPANDKPKRNSKPVVHFINEQPKYTKGKYHYHKDGYDRGYNGYDITNAKPSKKA